MRGGLPRAPAGLLALALPLCLAPKCEAPPELPPPGGAGECPDGSEPVRAEACDDVFCGDPVVRVGTGGSAYEAVAEGDDVAIVYGAQGGYHIFLSAEMENLCPVVFLDIGIDAVDSDGNRVPVHSQERHVQAVRFGGEGISAQHYWGILGYLPCDYYPAERNKFRRVNCGWESGVPPHPITQEDAILWVEARDHDGRVATDEVWVRPVYPVDPPWPVH